MLIAASVDDTADIAAKHIRARGWNQTHNVWLQAKDIQSYHIGGIPSVYIIDAKGTIAASGIAEEEHLNIPDIVNQHLDAARKESKKGLGSVPDWLSIADLSSDWAPPPWVQS